MLEYFEIPLTSVFSEIFGIYRFFCYFEKGLLRHSPGNLFLEYNNEYSGNRVMTPEFFNYITIYTGLLTPNLRHIGVSVNGNLTDE